MKLGVIAIAIGLGCGSPSRPSDTAKPSSTPANTQVCTELFDHLLHIQTQKEVAYTFGADPNEPDPAEADRQKVRQRVEPKRAGFLRDCGRMSAETIQCGQDAVDASLAVACDPLFDFGK